MPTIQKNELRRRVKLDGLERTQGLVLEALETEQLVPADFSLRDVFEAFVVNDSGEQVGRDVLDECFAPGSNKSFVKMEAAGAVSSDAFTNISGQVLFNTFLKSYQSEDFVFTNMIPTIPTVFSGERIPGISDIGDKAMIVAEGETYPLAGVNENYIDTPQTVKRGVIVPVTKEAVFFDRTGLLLDRASKVGTALGINKEKRAIDCVIDENTTAHRYKWRGTVYGTYQTSTPWINDKTSNGLVDWTNIDAVELLLAAITDPDTGEPVMIMADTLMVAPQLFKAASRILNATNINVSVGGFATTGNLSRTNAPNPIGMGQYTSNYKLVSTRLMPTRSAVDTDFWLGNPKQACAYMQNWPITITQAPPNSEEEFNRDIFYRFKAGERGAYFVRDPRFLSRSAA